MPFREIGSDGKLLTVGLWRCNQLGDSPKYCSELCDETFLILEGEAHIRVLETVGVFRYSKGDVGSWSQGTKTIWHVVSPVKKFYVVAEP